MRLDRPLRYCTSFASANCGGTLTSMWMWSGEIAPCVITTSRPGRSDASRSRVRVATSPRSTFAGRSGAEGSGSFPLRDALDRDVAPNRHRIKIYPPQRPVNSSSPSGGIYFWIESIRVCTLKLIPSSRRTANTGVFHATAAHFFRSSALLLLLTLHARPGGTF